LFSAEAKKPAESFTMPVLHVCWFQLMHLIGNPADIISHDPRIAGALPANPLRALLTTGQMDSEGNPLIRKFDADFTEYTASNLRRCFFMACAAVKKLVDIFYGDSQLSIDFGESDELMRLWLDVNHSLYEDWLRHQQVVIIFDLIIRLFPQNSNGSVYVGDNATAMQIAASSGGGGLKNTLAIASASKSRAASGNKAQKPFVGERQPKVARMLDTFMDWLVQSSLMRSHNRSASKTAQVDLDYLLSCMTALDGYL
uniref:Ufd2P_core domain-containing protein n=1 Tax=Gongylonema pulchrum TaxID=637853 RepID=A0A183DQS6_9BILA